MAAQPTRHDRHSSPLPLRHHRACAGAARRARLGAGARVRRRRRQRLLLPGARRAPARPRPRSGRAPRRVRRRAGGVPLRAGALRADRRRRPAARTTTRASTPSSASRSSSTSRTSSRSCASWRASPSRARAIVVTTPNTLNANSRLRSLLQGFPLLFDPLPLADGNVRHLSGHIHPISPYFLAVAALRAGLVEPRFHPDRTKTSAVIQTALLAPVLWLGPPPSAAACAANGPASTSRTPRSWKR